MISNETLNNKYLMLKDSLEDVMEYIEQNSQKINTSSKKDNKYEPLEKINAHMQRISRALWQNDELFDEEIICFSQVEHYIIYIIYNNCVEDNFGHVNCTLYLLNIFKELIDAKFKFLFDEKQLEDYATIKKQYSKDLDNFSKYFYEHIFIESHEFDYEIDELNRMLSC